MTEPTPITTVTGPSEHAARYEALRGHVLGPHHALPAREGLAVLLRQGVAAWMTAWSRVPAPAVRAAQDEREQPPLPDGASAEVVRVLAAMALGHIEEAHA
jgi:hypothetical protein